MKKKIMRRQMAVSVSEDTWSKILKVTDKEGISNSSWIRQAIEKHLCYKSEIEEEVIEQLRQGREENTR